MAFLKMFYTTGEAAAQIGVSSETINNWIKKGIIKAITLPTGQKRIPRREIDRILHKE